MKLEQAREVLGVTADATEDEIKKQFRKFAMQWHPDKAAHCTPEEKERREEKMKEINSAYVRLQKGEDSDDDEDDDYFPTGPWSMPDELIALLMETLLQQRMGKGRRGGGRGPSAGFPMGGGAGPGFNFDIPMSFSHGGGRGPPGRGGYGGSAYAGAYYEDDSEDEEDSDEEGCHFAAYEHARPRRRPGVRRDHSDERTYFSQEDYEKNRAAEHALFEHQKREAERLHMRRQKAEVMKVIDKLPKPVKTDVSDSSISLTIDRNRKLRGALPPGGFWELQYRQTHGRGDEHAWRPYAERLTDTTVTVERLVPGTSYDFRARGGFEGMGDISMGGFSVTATVSTTGRKPAAAAASAAAAAASAAVPAKSVGKGGAKAARSAGEAVRSCTEQLDVAAAAGTDEAEQRRQAQREEAAAREAAVAAAARDAAAKREAERKKAVQARLDQEAEEYAQLMAQHARTSAPAAGGDSKKKKKKKQKKDAEAATAATAALAADPLPESIGSDVLAAERDPHAHYEFETAPVGEQWKAVRSRDRPKSSTATPNGMKAATARAAHPAPPPAEAPAPPPGAPVFEDVSPEEIQRLRQERAAALAAEEELMLQEALARSLSEMRMDEAELLRLESDSGMRQHAVSKPATERQTPHRAPAAGGVRGAHTDVCAAGAAAAAAAAASTARRVAASGGLPRAGGRSGRGAQRGRGGQPGRPAEDGGGRTRRGRGRVHAHGEWSAVDARRSARPQPHHSSPPQEDPIPEPFDPIPEPFDAIPEPALPSPIHEPLEDPIPEHTSDYSSTLHESFSTSAYALPQTPDYIQQTFEQPDYPQHEYQQPDYAQHDSVQHYAPPSAYATHDAYAVPPQPGGHSPLAAFDDTTFSSPSVLQSPQSAPVSDAWGPPPDTGADAPPPRFPVDLGAADWSAGGADGTLRGVAAAAGGGLGVRPQAGRGRATQGRLFQAYNKRHPGAAAHSMCMLSSAGGPADTDAPSPGEPSGPPPMHGQSLDHSSAAAVATTAPAYHALPSMQPGAPPEYASAQNTLSPDSSSFQPQPHSMWSYSGQGAPMPSPSTPLDTSMYAGTPVHSTQAAQHRAAAGVPSYAAQSVNLPDTLIDTPSTVSAASRTQVPPHPPAHPPPPVQHNGMVSGGYYGMQNGRTAAGDGGMYGAYGFAAGPPAATDAKPYSPQAPPQQQPQHMHGWYPRGPPGMFMNAAWGPPHYQMQHMPHGMHVAPINGYHGHADASAAGQQW